MFCAHKTFDYIHIIGHVFLLVIIMEYEYDTTQFSCQIVSRQFDIPVCDLPAPSSSSSGSRGRRLGAFISHRPAISFPNVLCLSDIFHVESFSYF